MLGGRRANRDAAAAVGPAPPAGKAPGGGPAPAAGPPACSPRARYFAAEMGVKGGQR